MPTKSKSVNLSLIFPWYKIGESEDVEKINFNKNKKIII
jgi:hypothetical protein